LNTDPIELGDLKARLRSGQRLLGLDVGSKTIGLALSDGTLTIATAYATLKRGKFAATAAELAKIVVRENVGGLVIGLPLNMDGSAGPMVRSVRQFQQNLAALVPLPMAFWDERLSTAAMDRFLIDEADASRAKRAASIDKLAAAYILQGALDRLAHRP
jgi:putative Holliday junction resolvase